MSHVDIVRSVPALRERLREVRATGQRVGLIPTMGALHVGHLSLVARAREAADFLIVSIFVNPLQFGPREDFAAYPRQLEIDRGLCAQAGVAVVYAPGPDAMYPPGFATSVEVAGVTERWCGASRPGHFRGVTTVVAKLLNAAMADVAVFGEKDWQQLQAIRQLARDLDHPTAIVGAPIVREPDGLAMSSRNAYLSPDERLRATAIARALILAQQRVAAGQVIAADLEAEVTAAIANAGGRIDYVAIVDPETLVPMAHVERPARLLVAAHFGRTRLLDNIGLR